ncbi:unnamed protein product [Peronospora belbahrii]|uniref:FYVE-type domain-containing protein n=1 Tax=Peronospora belbahrii TaxID=622444 RepID=A0ABN8CYH2_9STRA|nr:unnamed protein product [Peronospora belbahrii]
MMTRLFLMLTLVLLGVRYSWAPLVLVHIIWWMMTRLLQIVVLFVGSGSFWWILRSYQLQQEQELLDQALLKFNFYRRYRDPVGVFGSNKLNINSGNDHVFSGRRMTDAGFQLRVLKQLPIVAHLRTSWGLPREICEEIGDLVELIVKHYVSFWFEPISPNKDFPNDVKFLLADLLGAVASRVLEIDPSQALTLVAKTDEHPAVFEGDEIDSNLLKRQEYVIEFVQRSSFVHPGCVGAGATTSLLTPDSVKKDGGENAEEAYLRHVATQLLTQLNPQLGQQQNTNVFVSISMNLLREIVSFKILKPLSEYLQPRYANEIVLSCIQALVDGKKDVVEPVLSSTSSTGNVVGMVPTLTLNKLRSTSSILYKASRRSGEQAEAAFQAVVEAVANAASSAAAGAAEMVLEGDDWTDPGNNPFAFGGAVFAANSGGFTGERKTMPLMFAMDDRLNIAKTAKLMSPLGLISGGLRSNKTTVDNGRISGHMDDLKNAKTNIGSSLNSSIGKVKRRFRTLGSYQIDPLSTPPLGAGAGAAARMLRKQGQLLQKAWKRGESGASSPSSSFGDGATTPTDQTRGRRNARITSSLNSLVSPLQDDDGMSLRTTSDTMKMAMVRDRVVRHLVKAVANYTKMYAEYPEMHSSSRSRELYDLLSAMENVFMVGFRNHDTEDEGDNKAPSTPPLSPNARPCVSVASVKDELTFRRDSKDTERCPSYLDVDEDIHQYYWEYLAQDRPGAESFNTHWRFVAFQCPTCSPSESFVSTRGVQWVLAALAKGFLGTLCAELYAHSDITELFYDSFALLLDTTHADSVLEALSQLDNLNVCFDVPFLSGFHNDSDQEFSGSPPNEWRPHNMASPCAPVCVLERAWEIERHVPVDRWVKATDKRWQELPSSEWIWEDDWALENTANGPGESSDSEATESMWEYAKNYEDTYHKKKKKLDSVRRRQWVRRRCQLPPVLVLPSLPVSPNDSGVSSPLASSAIPSSAKKEGKLKQRFDAVSCEKKNDKGNDKGKAANKSMLKSRPRSDKEMPDSPMSDSTLGLTDSDELQQTSSKASTFMKARASIPSLRRGTGNKRTKSFSCDFQPLSAKSSLNGDPRALYDNDDNDSLCFRCLKAFPASNLGVGTCHSCHRRVCASCFNFYAFMVYPPPFETFKKARVCGNCYNCLVSKYKLRIEAHVGEYLVKEREREIPDISSSRSAANSSTSHPLSCTSDSGVSGVGSSAASRQTACRVSSTVGHTNSTRFEIAVKVKGDSAYAWSVTKTYHDFVMLEKQLIEKLKKQEQKFGVGCQACHLKGVDYMEMTSIKSSLKTVAIASISYEKQLYILEQFLQQLLACGTLCQSSVVQKFFLIANTYGTSRTMGSPLISRWEAGENLTFPFVSSSTGGGAFSNIAGSTNPEVSGTGDVLEENGKWQKGPDAKSKETKMRLLQKIEVSLFAVLGEVFEFDGIGMVRRQIFSMTRSFIKAFLGASHFRMLERQFLSFTDPKKLSGWISDLKLYIFSDMSDVSVAPSAANADMQVLRKDCLEAILASFPSKALSLFGDTACENAALKLHEFLQHEIFVKNLLFSISDELLLHLFPNSTPFKSKKKTPRETRTAPPRVSRSGINVATTVTREVAINDDASSLITLPMSPIVASPSPLTRTIRNSSKSSSKQK